MTLTTRRRRPPLLALLGLAVGPGTLPPAPAQAEAGGRALYLAGTRRRSGHAAATDDSAAS